MYKRQEYGKDIQDIYEKMKELISREVKKMTHLDVIEVNVNVVDIKSKEAVSYTHLHLKTLVKIPCHLKQAGQVRSLTKFKRERKP